MKRRWIAVLVIAIAGAPFAVADQTTADPRALEECQASEATFVQVADCLPEAHVAYMTIDAFEELYPAEAMPLVERCVELNDRIRGAGSCVTNAVQAALQLHASLPEGASVDDPVFQAISDGALFEELRNAILIARQAFPDRRMWGGGVFQPYR